MSHEFELHHLVSELVSLLQVSDTADVDAQVDLLNKNRTPYITNQVGTVEGGVAKVNSDDCSFSVSHTHTHTQVSAYAAKRKIAEFSSQGEQFLQKYDDLKIRQTRNLDPLVYLVSKVTEDRRLCGFLHAVRPHIEKTGPQEIGEVKVLDLVEGEEVELPEKGTCHLMWVL